MTNCSGFLVLAPARGNSALGAGSSSAVHGRKWERAESKEQSAASAVEDRDRTKVSSPLRKKKIVRESAFTEFD